MRVTGCGVCHSDLHLWNGYFDLGGEKRTDVSRIQSLPHTLGHEIAGVVEALGDSARGCTAGDPVVVYPWIGCGECDVCARGMEHVCARPRSLGVSADGGYAEYVVVPHSRYLLDFGDIPPTRAGTYACSGLTAFGALSKVKERCEGRHLMIIGAGGVGLAALTIAPALLDASIIVVDVDEAKLEKAKQLGAHHVVNPAHDGARKTVRELTGGGVAGAVDFVGSPQSVGFGMSVAAQHSQLVVVGLFGGSLELSLPLLPMKSLSLMGSYVGSLDELQQLMALAKSGAIRPLPIETRPLDEADQTLRDLDAGRIVGRVVLVPRERERL